MRIRGLNQKTINSFILDMLFPVFGFIFSLSFKNLHKCLTKVLVALLSEVQCFAGLETHIYQSPLMTIIVIVVPNIKSFAFQGFCWLIFLPAYISRFLTFYSPLHPLLLIVLHPPIWSLSLFPSTLSFPASCNHKQRWQPWFSSCLANKGQANIPPGGERQLQSSKLWRKWEVGFTSS